MSSKAYSTRFQYGDDLDEEIILKLDAIENQGEDSGEWLREAARMRIQSDQVEESNVDNNDGEFTYRASPDGIDVLVQNILQGLSDEQRSQWIREAIQMRAAIESNAPAFFISRWNQTNGIQDNHASGLPGFGQSIYAQTMSGPPIVDLGPPDDGFNEYRMALPALLRLEMVERG